MAASRAGDPPESTLLRIGDDIAWSEINGVYDRDDSLKENTNPKCLLKNHPHHNGSSQRFSGNLKPTAAPIIGLSGKLGARRQQHHHPPAIFPKKAKTGAAGARPRRPSRSPSPPRCPASGRSSPTASARASAARRGRAGPRGRPGAAAGSGS